jgi:hydrogenase expression/formation protein HypE
MKVVEKGKCDKLFINTSGIGIVENTAPLSIDKIRPGDAVVVNGFIGEHAISVLSKREGISFGSAVKSDSAPLNGLISGIMRVSRKIRFMRDPTRGGLAATLNEIVLGRKFSIAIDEARIPISKGVKSACEMLGLDQIYLANEGKVIIIVAREDEAKVLKVIRRHRLGARAEIIGRVESGNNGKVYLKTSVGGKRIVDMPAGDQLPRIC